MQKMYLLDDQRRQRLALARRQTKHVPPRDVATQRRRLRTPYTRHQEEDERCEEDGAAAKGYGQGHAEEVADGHEERGVGHQVCDSRGVGGGIHFHHFGDDGAEAGGPEDGEGGVDAYEEDDEGFVPCWEVEGVWRGLVVGVGVDGCGKGWMKEGG